MLRLAATVSLAASQEYLLHDLNGVTVFGIDDVKSWERKKCDAPYAHHLYSSENHSWPCELVTPATVVRPNIGADDLQTWLAGGTGQQKLLMVGIGMMSPSKLTADMLNIGELIWPLRSAPPPRIHIFIRAGAYAWPVLIGMHELLNTVPGTGVIRIDFELAPWGLRSFGITADRLLTMLDVLGFGYAGVAQASKRRTKRLWFRDVANTSVLSSLVDCEGGILPSFLSVEKSTWHSGANDGAFWGHAELIEAVGHNSKDRCCWPTFYRGRQRNGLWTICCNKNPPQTCYQDVPRGRSLRSCCSRSSPLAAFQRFLRANRPTRDPFLESAVLKVSKSTEQLYEEQGSAIIGGEPSPPVMGFAPREFQGNHERSIGLPDIELFVQLRNKVWDGASRTSWAGWPIFILGNAFGMSTFVLAKVFAGAAIDALDAEDGDAGTAGSEMTRKIALANNLDVNLFIGYSPEATPLALRFLAYNLVFIDGEHTAKQLVLDFASVLPFLQASAVVVCHDIALADVSEGITQILKSDIGEGFTFQLYTSTNYINDQGTGFFYRGFDSSKFTGL